MLIKQNIPLLTTEEEHLYDELGCFQDYEYDIDLIENPKFEIGQIYIFNDARGSEKRIRKDGKPTTSSKFGLPLTKYLKNSTRTTQYIRRGNSKISQRCVSSYLHQVHGSQDQTI